MATWWSFFLSKIWRMAIFEFIWNCRFNNLTIRPCVKIQFFFYQWPNSSTHLSIISTITNIFLHQDRLLKKKVFLLHWIDSVCSCIFCRWCLIIWSKRDDDSRGLKIIKHLTNSCSCAKWKRHQKKEKILLFLKKAPSMLPSKTFFNLIF